MGAKSKVEGRVSGTEVKRKVKREHGDGNSERRRT